MQINEPQKYWGVAHWGTGQTGMLFTDELFTFKKGAEAFIQRLHDARSEANSTPLDVDYARPVLLNVTVTICTDQEAVEHHEQQIHWLENDSPSARAKVKQVSASEADEFSGITGLTKVQREFLLTVDNKWCMREVADYLRRNVEVCIVHNRDVSEAPPFALDVVERPGFWIGCFDTSDEAQSMAQRLGLKVRSY